MALVVHQLREAQRHPVLLLEEVLDQQKVLLSLAQKPAPDQVAQELRHKELRELLLEVLTALQPSPEEEISRLVGTLTPPRSSPSSAS